MDDTRLDALLGAYRITDPGAKLRARIIAAAPRQRAIGRAWRWLGAAGLGAVLAGSCAAGVAAGLTLAPASLTRLISGHTAPTAAISSLADPADDPAIG
ncbi:MAG TPA: hypothetical protein VHS81_13590 [Caulobacteraceae bacterium]|jgi:hypothetical protein|nr:hypothetical protein [Caulobacteraceae bacterium]